MHQEMEEDKPLEVDQYTSKQLVHVLVNFLSGINKFNIVVDTIETDTEIIDLTSVFMPFVKKYSAHVDFNKMGYDDLQILTFKVFTHFEAMLHTVEENPKLPLLFDFTSNTLHHITALPC